MSGLALTRLPPEIHHEISLYLTNGDLICLSLTCKPLYKINSSHWVNTSMKSAPRDPWTLFANDSLPAQSRVEELWIARNELLPRLRRWIKPVLSEAFLRNESDLFTPSTDRWELCVGCATFKPWKEDWARGHDFANGRSLRKFVLDGHICKSCVQEWWDEEDFWR